MHRFRFTFAAAGLASVALAAAVLTAGLAGCKSDSTAPAVSTTYDGQSAALGSGTMTAYEEVDAKGGIVTVGLRFTEGMLQNLPDHDTSYALALPMKSASSPFTHLLIDWNAHGHEPVLYELPHFDIHFYLVSQQQRLGVIPGPDTVVVPAAYVPAHYISTMAAVPAMGTHWVDTTSAEFHGSLFDKTTIYGFYRGALYFLEPMITKAYFDAKPNATINIPQPASFAMSGKAFPTTYTVTYDAVAKSYTVALRGMAMH